MEKIVYLLLFCSAFTAVFLFCIIEKWYKRYFSMRCIFCWSFWICTIETLLIGLADEILRIPLYDITLAPAMCFALFGCTAFFYFFIKQAFL